MKIEGDEKCQVEGTDTLGKGEFPKEKRVK